MASVVVKRSNKGSRVFTFVMSMKDVVWLGVGAALALTVFFVFGLLVGRGYVPTEETTTVDQGQVQVQVEEQVEPEVLRAEELSYPEKLSPSLVKPGAEPGAQEQAAAGQPTDQAVDQAGNQNAEQPAGQEADQAAEQTVDQAGNQTAGQATGEAAGQGGDELLFDYVYQVSSFKEESMAQALADKLTAQGMTTEIVSGENKGVTWYRVRVLATCTPPDIDALRDKIFSVTKVDPLLLSKKPAQ